MQSSVFGLSSLREKEKQPTGPTEKSLALQAYLNSKYTSGDDAAKGKKKKKKRKAEQQGVGVQIIDNDNTGFAQHTGPTVQRRASKSAAAATVDDDSASEEDAPVVANPGEAERLKRLLQKEREGQARQAAVGLSPPRRRQADSADDLSPPRRPGGESAADLSPPRRRGAESAREISPPRRRHNSPPRENRDGRRADLPPRAPKGEEDGKRKRVMADGMAAGLVAGKDIRAEVDKKRAAERAHFQSLGAEATGRNAQTVYRDAQGKIVGSAEELKKLKEAEEAAKKPQAETPEWGGGLKQMRDRAVRQEEMQREAAKPFARTKDDADLDSALRERERFGDPMAHLVRRRQAQAPAPAIVPEHMAKQMRKSGFMVPQEVPAHSWLKRNMGPPPNRYGIKPGRHWDGVDRSNGFESDAFRQRNEQAALAHEARMWAQSDM
ncbi:hypothetical protein WJX73_006982 [Symbiochloris irregularis]|uniref:Uncharacterized protein n=1 Tax=Symbiochloris irregularis TaxID=706552 RepID=A0AAW1P7Z8_9CHLO